MAQKKIYDPVRIYELTWSLQYTQERDNVRLRYDGMSMFTIMSDRGDTEFVLSDIFFVLRNIVGIISNPRHENILLKFVNEADARQICLERYAFEKYPVGCNFYFACRYSAL